VDDELRVFAISDDEIIARILFFISSNDVKSMLLKSSSL
jgi:hypothetical protein